MRNVAFVVIALALAASVYIYNYQLLSTSALPRPLTLLLRKIHALSPTQPPASVFYSNNTSAKCMNITKRIPTIKVDFVGDKGEGGCLNRSFASSKNYFPKTALSGFPASGNTWVRYLLEQLTGNYLNQEQLTGNQFNQEQLTGNYLNQEQLTGNYLKPRTTYR